MQEFFGSVWWLIVSLGVLVTFHEFGHYWVARRCGVRVLRFSVGFGRPLWRRIGRDGTEYVVAAIPLGGYVKMLDEREDEVAPEHAGQAFNRKSVWQRFAIVAAGPAFNLILCVFLLWAMFVVGKTDQAPVVGEVQGIAADAGLKPDDRLVTLDGHAVPTWTDAIGELMIGAIDRRPMQVEVSRDDRPVRLVLDLARLPVDFDQADPFGAMGLRPRHWNPPAVIGAVSAGDPAAQAGIETGDRIVAIGTTPITLFQDIPTAIAAQAAEGRALQLTVERDGARRTLQLTPKWKSDDDRPRWIIGVSPAADLATLRYGPIEAIGAAVRETGEMAVKTVGLLGRMLTGQASLKNISGPITIAQVANASASIGLDWFLSFLALLSLSLCIMNLLPIPILDGGHLMYLTAEMIKGRPVSERVMVAGQYVGLGLLACLMGLAFYNDILRLVSS